jgi:S-adenosylmethionine:tRNA ribosyltransferase-isomerase
MNRSVHGFSTHGETLAGQAPADQRMPVWDFELPAESKASTPPEERGLARDGVRMIVSYRADNRIAHARFHEFARFLDAGDAVVINTSGTLNAALPAARADGTAVELHLSTHLPGDLWVVEVRLPSGATTVPFYDLRAGETFSLPAGAALILHACHGHGYGNTPGRARLWIATLRVPDGLEPYLARYGFPIRYGYVAQAWPLTYYQTVYTTEMGSAEMPSAGRAFTPELITRLIAHGVYVTPVLLHTGVASLEVPEPPYEEFYRVSVEAARLVNTARQAGGRVVAVGTTVVRALETVTDAAGTVHPGEGWTKLVITPQYSLRAVDALLTGLHEPRSSHLAMLEALAGRNHLKGVYADALQKGYLWHEFGDLHLLMP